MQALILAAGMGKRLGALTKENTKCQVEVNGKTLIERSLTQLANLSEIGVTLQRIILVIGYKGEALRSFVGDSFRGIPIEYVENSIYDTTNNIYSLYLAKDKLCEDDTLLLESDLIYDDAILPRLVRDPYPNLALVAKYESWMDGTMVCIDDDHNIVNFVPKSAFVYDHIDQYYKTVNIYKFSAAFSRMQYVPFLEAYATMMGRNEYYEQVLRVLVTLDKSTMKALPLQGEKWYEIDDIQDLDIASTLFSDSSTRYHEYHKRYGGYWRFPQLLDYCYLVNPFFPTQRMKDELRASFDTLLANYPSGQGINSLLAGKYFGIQKERIVVGNGAAELIKVVMEQHVADKVGVIFPTFDEYPNRLPADRIVPFVSQDPTFRYTVDDLIAFYGEHPVGLLLLINPDNPSGNFIFKAEVLRLAKWCQEKNVVLLLDESFVDFSTESLANTLLKDDLLAEFPTMLVMKSISKSYGVPGLRLGVLASGNTELIARVKKEVSIWNINSFAEYYLQIFGKYEKDYARACDQFIAERETFYRELQTIPYLRVFPSQANYFLCEVTSSFTSAELTQKLIEQNVLVSNCGRKRLMEDRNLVRLAIRSRAENAKLVEILRSLS